MSAPAAQVGGIDHVVLTATDLDRTVAFYEALGLEAVAFGPDGRPALQAGAQRINLHRAGREFLPKAAVPTPGSLDLCLYVEGPIEDVADRLARAGVPIVEGPVDRIGATGPLRSVYVHDPDGNLVELAERV